MTVLSVYSVAAIIAIQKELVSVESGIKAYVNKRFEALNDIYDEAVSKFKGDRFVTQLISKLLYDDKVPIPGIQNYLELSSKNCKQFCVDVMKLELNIGKINDKNYKEIIEDVLNSEETMFVDIARWIQIQ